MCFYSLFTVSFYSCKYLFDVFIISVIIVIIVIYNNNNNNNITVVAVVVLFACSTSLVLSLNCYSTSAPHHTFDERSARVAIRTQ